jgi:hypothetical protein
MPDWEIIVALIVGLVGGGGIVAYLRLYFVERRGAEINAWTCLINAQQTRIDQLGERVAVMESQLIDRDLRIDDLEQEIDELRGWIKEQGMTPPPRPQRRKRSA